MRGTKAKAIAGAKAKTKAEAKILATANARLAPVCPEEGGSRKEEVGRRR
jgi:hypothetical protein